MNSAPRLSVIIPNYNHASFLEQRIESVLNQTYQDFEVIILDDCSTDHSRDIIERYRNHPKVRLILYNETNSGNTFVQWKKGIELAEGAWIWMAESDDWCEPTFLEETYPSQDDPNLKHVVLSYCGSIMYRGNDILLYPTIRHMNSVVEGKTFVRNYMASGNAIYNASMCIFRKSAFNVIQHLEKFVFSGDWFVWIHIALQGDVKISGKCLNYFRKHDTDVSGASYLNGTYHTEYLTLQKYLLDNEHIDAVMYQNNVFRAYATIAQYVRQHDADGIYKLYREAYGKSLKIRSLKRSMHNLVRSLIQVYKKDRSL
jgi:glycosyltransferase involved in cell wall biosynthesis